MKENCKLIATLPALNNMDKVENIFRAPHISEVRFNTGAQTPYSVDETLTILKNLSTKYKKQLWIDLKGRQLRVIKWADPLYSCVELNHKIHLLYPARIYFRNGDSVNITHVKDGNKIFVDPLPKYALGAGQSVNILAKDIEIEGYLTDKDKEYLEACKKFELRHIMASFVESLTDLAEISTLLPHAKIVSKIESEKGLSLISQYKMTNLMAARDDLYLQTGQNYKLFHHLRAIIKSDPKAICASRIFLSLEKKDTVDFADFADLELMYRMGYRKFMLCDNICNYHFEKALYAWEEFIHG